MQLFTTNNSTHNKKSLPLPYISKILPPVLQSILLFLLTTASSIAETPSINLFGINPTPFAAEYKVTKGIMSVGSTHRKLEHKGDGYYFFESVTKPGGIAKLFTSGKVVERSHWRLLDNKLVPQEYEYINSSDNKRNVKVKFDWNNNKVTNTVNGDPWSMDVEEETLDKLIFQLAVMYDLSQGATLLIYQVADGGKTKTYNIDIIGEEQIVTELGTFNTIKVVRTNNNRTTTMWCAKELQYLPAKIEQQKKDDSPVTAELVDLKGIPVPKNTKPAQPTSSK